MSEHLTSHEVTDWRYGVTGPEEILRLDDHLAECAECRSLVSDDIKDDMKDAISSLQVEFSQEHLTESQLDDYAAHKPISVDMMQHLDQCLHCRAEADDLRQFAAANRIIAPVPGPTRRSTSAWRHSLAAAVAFAAVGLSVWLVLQKQKPAGPSLSSAPTEVASNIPPQYLSEVNAAIQTGTLHVPASIATLVTGPIQLRSTDPVAGHSPLHALSPVATAVVEDRPTFRWTAAGPSYVISVYDDQFRPVAHGTSTTTEWQPEKPLPRGATYRWEVRATKGNLMDSDVKFTVLSASDAQRLAEARAAMPSQPLALGILYANAGALDDAKRELSSAAATANPTDKTTAERLLGQLK